MGSDETAITVPGGPRVIDVFDGNGAPSGPNYLKHEPFVPFDVSSDELYHSDEDDDYVCDSALAS